MNKVKKVFRFIKKHWPLEVSVSIFLAVVALLLFVNLRTLIGGYSQPEVDTSLITSSFPSIRGNLVYWPYYLAVYVARFFVNDGVLAARLVSACLGFVASFNILLIIKRWYSTEIGIVGATIFVSGSWFLQIARSGTPEILGIAVILTIFAGVLWLISSPSKSMPSIVVFLAVASGMFVPFIPMLMLFGLVLAVVKERQLLKIVPNWLWVILGIAALTALTFLIIGFKDDFSQTRSLLAIPQGIPSLKDILLNLRSSLAAIFWFAPTNPDRWLANLPLLDIFGVVMLTLGVYHHERYFGSRRSIILFGSSVILLGFVSLNGGINSIGFSLLLPMVSLLIISGLQEFLNLWREVFPRNPIAKGVSVLVISILVGVSSYYQLNRYYVAWANDPATRAVYSANIAK